MDNHITIIPATGNWVVRAGDMILGTSAQVQHLTEGNRAPVAYVPRADIDMTRLSPTSHTTTCPFKGKASYFSITTPQGVLTNAVWSYETPIAGCEAIAGHLAFYPDRVTLSKA
jgi:uncharacterized protein (DUF427 family)